LLHPRACSLRGSITMVPETFLNGDHWFNGLADSLPALIWCAGPDGRCTYFNSRWLQFTGRTLQESLGDGWSQDVHPEDRDRVMRDYSHYLEGHQSFRLEYRLKSMGGPYRWIVDFGSPVFGKDRTFHASLRPAVERIAEALVAIRDRMDDQHADPVEIGHLKESIGQACGVQAGRTGRVRGCCFTGKPQQIGSLRLGPHLTLQFFRALSRIWFATSA
jgi:PAS domain S-box-containing protein